MIGPVSWKFKAAEEEARQNRRGAWSEGQVFESAWLLARSILSTPDRRVADPPARPPAAPTDRQSERKSALQALQSAPPAASTAPPPTDNPPHLAPKKAAAGSTAMPASAASVSPPLADPTAPTRSPQGEGPRKVAERLINNLKKKMEKQE